MKLFVRALTCVLCAVSVFSPAVAREVKTLPALSVVTYQKVCEDFGWLTNGWKLTSALAYNGTADVSWIATSNRACTAANMDAGTATRGELPSGPYVHVLAAVAQWDGTRTRSLRVQFAQPAGSRDLYARVVAVTVSQPGKNLLHVEDLYNLKDDKTLVESASTAMADLQTCPVKAVRLEEKAGYIESAGKLYFNTGYRVGRRTRIELDFALTEVENTIRLFGVSGKFAGSGVDQQFEVYIGSPRAGELWLSYATLNASGERQAANVLAADTDRHTIVLGYANGQQKFQVLTAGTVMADRTLASDLYDGVSACPLGLFAKNYTEHGLFSSSTTTYLYPSKMRVYGLKIYEDDVLVRDYLPCLKGGVAGLKESCSGRFFMGDDIKAATVGGDVLEEMDDPYIASQDNWIDRAAGQSVYLDTGYTVGPGTRVELDYALLTPDWETNNLYKAADNNPNPFLLDASSASPYMGIYLYGGSAAAGYCVCQLGAGSVNLTELRLNTAYGVRRTVVMDSNTVTVVTSGFTNFVKSVAAANAIKTTLGSTLKIASRNNLTRFLPVRVYGLRIYEAGGLQKDYRPFVKDMKPGLVNALDETDRIYTTTYSSQGVRTDALFTPGGAIAGDESLAGAYLEFDAVDTHNLNTGYVVTKDTCIEIDLALWCTDNTTQQFYFEQRGYKKTAADCNGVWARLYMSGSNFAYQFKDYPSSFSGTVMFAVNQERTKFKFDAYNNRVSAERCGETVFDQAMVGTRTAMTCTSPLYIGSNWSGSNNSGLMRLYGFKISEAGTAVHNYVPYRRGTEVGLYDVVGDGGFLPLVGGRVSGANTGADEFQIFPQDTKLEVAGTDTLRCLAAGAVSYRWYCNGILLPDETGETLTVVWRKGKPRTDIYAVVPVYEVYCNSVSGARATATVEHSVRGMSIILR